MLSLNVLVNKLFREAKKISETEDLIEFQRGKYFFGVVKNKKKIEGITVSMAYGAKYTNRTGFKIIDSFDKVTEKSASRFNRYFLN